MISIFIINHSTAQHSTYWRSKSIVSGSKNAKCNIIVQYNNDNNNKITIMTFQQAQRPKAVTFLRHTGNITSVINIECLCDCVPYLLAASRAVYATHVPLTVCLTLRIENQL